MRKSSDEGIRARRGEGKRLGERAARLEVSSEVYMFAGNARCTLNLQLEWRQEASVRSHSLTAFGLSSISHEPNQSISLAGKLAYQITPASNQAIKVIVQLYSSAQSKNVPKSRGWSVLGIHVLLKPRLYNSCMYMYLSREATPHDKSFYVKGWLKAI
jgi:hypothetical protein